MTGGGAGLGRAIVDELFSAGAKVVVLDVDEEALASLNTDERLLPVRCDLRKSADIENALSMTEDIFGTVDCLVNNVGVIHNEPLLTLVNGLKRHKEESFREVISVNLEIPFRVTSRVVEKMVQARVRGVVVNITSISAKGNPGQTAYSAAKAGLEAMTRVWAKELGPMQIRCIAIAPGFIDTPSTRESLTPATINAKKEQIALRRLGDSKSIGLAVRQVIENDYITGVSIRVDGGASI